MPLRRYQIEGKEFLLQPGGRLLNDEQGLGKTVTATAASATLRGPKLVICNSVARTQWAKEIRIWDHHSIPIIFAGTAGRFDFDEVRQWFIPPLSDGYLITYHPSLIYSWEQLRKIGTWKVIIVDEAHKHRNRNNKWTQKLKRLRTVYKWALTGTSFDKSPAELWSILNWFSPKKFNSYWNFVRDHIETKDVYIGRKKPITEPTATLKHPATFRRLVGPYVLRREKVQVAPEIPPAIPHDIVVPMTPGQRNLYDRVEEETIIELTKGSLDDALFIRNALVRMIRLAQVALDPGLVDVNHSLTIPKVEWIQEWAKEGGDQYIVFTTSKPFAKSLPMLIDGGVSLTGDDKLPERDDKLARFRSGKVRYIAGTVQLIAESIDLPQARAAIYADLPTSGIQFSQSQERIHRLTTTESPDIIRLLAERSVDYMYLRRLEGKLSDRKAVEMLIGGQDYG